MPRIQAEATARGRSDRGIRGARRSRRAAGAGPRVVLYSHDSFGLGHLRRCLKIAAALHRRVDHLQGLVVTGSPWAGLFPPPPGFGYWPLVPVTKTGPGAYAARQPGVEFAHALAARRSAIALALEHFQPDLFVVDNVPCGLQGELLPVLRGSHLENRPKTVLALRDVLDAPELIEAQWEAAGAYDVVAECYDEVWVFGDAAPRACSHGHLARIAADQLVFCGRIGETAGPPHAVERRVAHRTGPPCHASPKPRPVVLVTGGGGGDSAEMIGAYASALRHAPVVPESRIVLGPDFCGELPRFAAGDPHVRFTRFCPDLPRAIAEADAVVSMAGYNTTCEILDAGTPAVLIPRTWPRREQLIRASQLAAIERVQCLPLEGLTPHTLWEAVERALEERRRPFHRSRGGEVAADRAARLLEDYSVAA